MAYSVPATHLFKGGNNILQGLQASSSAKIQELGERVEAMTGEEFTYVYLESSGVASYAGSPLVWIDTTASQFKVTTDLSDAAPTNGANGSGGFAGISAMANANASGIYIWMQTKGVADAVLVSAEVAVNDELIVSDENCLDDVTTYVTSVTSTTYRLIGKAMSAAAAGATGVHSTASIMLY